MKRFILAALAAVAFQPIAADAQVTFNGTPFNQEYFQFRGGSGVGGAYGVQVGPYDGRFVGTDDLDASWDSSVSRTVTTSDFSVYCVDFLHSASRSTGLVNTTQVVSDGGFGNTRGGAGTYGNYQRAAFLSSLFSTDLSVLRSNIGDNGLTRGNIWGGLHAAIWASTNPPAGGSLSDDAQTAFNYFAGLDSRGFDASDWYVLTRVGATDAWGATGDGKGQEFLMQVTERSVPEPGTILLMITGLLLMVGANRRRLADIY